jgi:hypothetical protein
VGWRAIGEKIMIIAALKPKALFGSRIFGGFYKDFPRIFGWWIFQEILVVIPLSPRDLARISATV